MLVCMCRGAEFQHYECVFAQGTCKASAGRRESCLKPSLSNKNTTLMIFVGKARFFVGTVRG